MQVPSPPTTPQVPASYRAPVAPWALWARGPADTGARPKAMDVEDIPRPEQLRSEKAKLRLPVLGDFMTKVTSKRKRHPAAATAETPREPPIKRVSFRPTTYLADVQHYFGDEATVMIQPFQDILWENRHNPNKYTEWTEVRLALDMAMMLSEEDEQQPSGRKSVHREEGQPHDYAGGERRGPARPRPTH